ncbi:hypothetical protein ABTE48_18655 [Acinetobacter baumannii]
MDQFNVSVELIRPYSSREFVGRLSPVQVWRGKTGDNLGEREDSGRSEPAARSYKGGEWSNRYYI